MRLQVAIRKFIRENIYEFLVWICFAGLINEILAFLYIPLINSLSREIIVKYWALGIGYIAVSGCFYFLSNYQRDKFIFKMKKELKAIYVKALWSRKPEQLEICGDGQYILGVSKLEESSKWFRNIINITFSAAMMIVTSLYILICMSYKYFLLILVLLLFLFIMMCCSQPIAAKQQKIYQQQKYNVTLINNMINGIEIIKSYFLQRPVIRIFKRNLEKVAGLEQNRNDYQVFLEVLQQTIRCLVLIAIPVITSVFVKNESQGENTIIVSTYAFFYMFNHISKMMGGISNIKMAKAGMKFANDIMYGEEIAQNTDTLEVQGELCTVNMSFKYDNYVFKDKNISFRDKAINVIKGASGCGKSTLLKCIVGLEECAEGYVVIDDQQIEREKLLELMAYAPQIPIIFHKSFYENIQLVNENVSRTEIDTLLTLLDSSMVKIVGKIQDATVLSGGQKQILSFLRTIYSNKSYLVFDEPTAFLSKEISDNVMKYLKKLSNQKCIIIASHDDNVISYADTLYEMREQL